MLVGKLITGVSNLVQDSKGTIKQVDQLLARRNETYNDDDAQPGDIFFHYSPTSGAGHGDMVAPDPTFKIDAVQRSGVRRVPMHKDRRARIGFRLAGNSSVALSAALLVDTWVGVTGYSSSFSGTGRKIHAGFGTCHFGKGAVGRLAKYAARGEDGDFKGPKNSTCAELCILAYQLCLSESDPMFPRLDAKHVTPNRVVRFLLENDLTWEYLGYRAKIESDDI